MFKKKYSNHQKPIRVLLTQGGIFSPTIKELDVSFGKGLLYQKRVIRVW
jgi:hypothetical protein